MAGADRCSKGEVLDVVDKNGGGYQKNCGFYPRSNGKPFVDFLHGTQNKKVFHPFVYSEGSVRCPLPLG